MLRVLLVDDEPPALDELSYLLKHEPGVDEVLVAASADEALRVLVRYDIDAFFLDIRMPGLSGLELARVISRLRSPPAVVFVTAYEEHAVEAFELNVVDYLLKPVRAERLAEAVRRVAVAVGADHDELPEVDETVQVELGGVTRFVSVNDIRYVEAHGDYVRLHTPAGSPLVRVSLTTLEDRWRRAGFVRVHRSVLVSVAHIEEIRFGRGVAAVVVDGTALTVSRRHTRELRDLLVRRAHHSRGRQR